MPLCVSFEILSGRHSETTRRQIQFVGTSQIQIHNIIARHRIYSVYKVRMSKWCSPHSTSALSCRKLLCVVSHHNNLLSECTWQSYQLFQKRFVARRSQAKKLSNVLQVAKACQLQVHRRTVPCARFATEKSNLVSFVRRNRWQTKGTEEKTVRKMHTIYYLIFQRGILSLG